MDPRGSKADTITGLVSLALTLVGFWRLYGNQDVSSLSFGNDPGPGLFPEILLWALGLLGGGLLLWGGIRGPHRDPESLAPAGGWRRLLLPCLMMGTLVGYVLLLPRIGFLGLAFVFSLFWVLLLGLEEGGGLTWRRAGLRAAEAVGLSLAIYVVFAKLVKVPLP